MLRNRRRKRKEEERGYFVLEMLFVSFILPIVFLSVYSVLDAAYVIFNTNGVFSQLTHSEMQVLRHFNREIGQTSPLLSPSRLALHTDSQGNSIVTFQIPVDWDNDGDVITSNIAPKVEWGAYDDVGKTTNGRLGAWVRYSVTESQLIRQVLDGSLVPIPGLQRVVANNVQSFLVTRDQRTLRAVVTLRSTDAIGQAGIARTFQATLNNTTMLRNAVN